MSKIKENPFLKFENGNLPLGFEVPDVSMFGMLKTAAENQPDSLAYEYFGTECTYRNLVEKIEERIADSNLDFEINDVDKGGENC